MNLRNQPRRFVIVSAITGALVMGLAGFAAASSGASHHVEIETPAVERPETSTADRSPEMPTTTEQGVETTTEHSVETETEHGVETETEHGVETETHDVSGTHDLNDDNGTATSTGNTTGTSVDDRGSNSNKAGGGSGHSGLDG